MFKRCLRGFGGRDTCMQSTTDLQIRNVALHVQPYSDQDMMTGENLFSLLQLFLLWMGHLNQLKSMFYRPNKSEQSVQQLFLWHFSPIPQCLHWAWQSRSSCPIHSPHFRKKKRAGRCPNNILNALGSTHGKSPNVANWTPKLRAEKTCSFPKSFPKSFPNKNPKGGKTCSFPCFSIKVFPTKTWKLSEKSLSSPDGIH